MPLMPPPSMLSTVATLLLTKPVAISVSTFDFQLSREMGAQFNKKTVLVMFQYWLLGMNMHLSDRLVFIKERHQRPRHKESTGMFIFIF
jgi:hypothetical protein